MAVSCRREMRRPVVGCRRGQMPLTKEWTGPTGQRRELEIFNCKYQ